VTRITSLAAAIAAAILLSACGSEDDEPTASAAAPAPAAAAATDGAPRTIEHAFGKTRIEGVPERVLALDGNQDIDSLLALGLQPTAMSSLGDGQSRPPYQAAKLDPSVKELKFARTEVNVEEVIAQRPDLILIADYDEKFYDELSKVAPTVGYNRDEGWEPVFREIATALGRSAQADKHIDAVEAKVAPTRKVVQDTGFDQIRLGMAFLYPEYYLGYGVKGHPGDIMAKAGVRNFVEPPGKQDTEIFGGHNSPPSG
jgi:iron complex transport system substrate-binding protein